MLVEMEWYAEDPESKRRCWRESGPELRSHDLARKSARVTETLRTGLSQQSGHSEHASMIVGRVGKGETENQSRGEIGQEDRSKRERQRHSEGRNGDERQSNKTTTPQPWSQLRNSKLETRTHGKPWRARLLDDRVLRRRLLSDVVQPRVPFGRGLRGVEVVLGVVDPSVTACGKGVSEVGLGQVTETGPASGSGEGSDGVWQIRYRIARERRERGAERGEPRKEEKRELNN